MIKKLALGVGILFGAAHIGLLGYVISKPVATQIPLPETGDYSSYRITAGPDGSYTVEYIGNDPRVMTEEVNSQRGGFFGGNRTTTRNTQYTQDGIKNQGGGDTEEGKFSAQQVECIEAAGGGRSSGALVGTSVAASAIPFVAGIPYVGWLAAGWVTMFGGQVGGDFGAEVATTIKDCE
jgi:hypothetical protein